MALKWTSVLHTWLCSNIKWSYGKRAMLHFYILHVWCSHCAVRVLNAMVIVKLGVIVVENATSLLQGTSWFCREHTLDMEYILPFLQCAAFPSVPLTNVWACDTIQGAEATQTWCWSRAEIMPEVSRWLNAWGQQPRQQMSPLRNHPLEEKMNKRILSKYCSKGSWKEENSWNAIE